MEAAGGKKKAPRKKGKGKGKRVKEEKAIGETTLGQTKKSVLVSVMAPKTKLVKRNARFELKYLSSAIFVSDAVAGSLLEYLGTKQYGRFASVSSDMWESELPWRTILMALNEHLPEGGRVQDMLAKHAPLSGKDPHPRSMVQFCLGLKMLCVGCEAKLWEGYFKSTFWYSQDRGERVCKDCHVEAFAAIGGPHQLYLKSQETHLKRHSAKRLYNMYSKDLKAQKITSSGQGISVAMLRAAAIKHAGGDILALTMALEGRAVAKVARKENRDAIKEESKDDRFDKIHAWLTEHGLGSLFVAHVDEKLLDAYVNKTGRLYRYLQIQCYGKEFEQLTTALSEISFFLSVSPSFRSVMERKTWRISDRVAALYALYKTPYRPVLGGVRGYTVRELVVVSKEHKEQYPVLAALAMLANRDSEEMRLEHLYRLEHRDDLAAMRAWEASAIVRAHVREQMATFVDPNLKEPSSSSNSSSSSSSSFSSSGSSRTSRTSAAAAASAAAAVAAAAGRSKQRGDESDDDSDGGD